MAITNVLKSSSSESSSTSLAISEFLMIAPVALWISERILSVIVEASGVTLVTVSSESAASAVDLLMFEEASSDSAFSVSTVS